MRCAAKRLAHLALGALATGLFLMADTSSVEGAPKRDGKKASSSAKSTKRAAGSGAAKGPAPLPPLPVWLPPEIRRTEGAVERISIPLPSAASGAALIVVPVGTRDEAPGEEGTLGRLVATMPTTSISRAAARRDEVVVSIADPARPSPAWSAPLDASLEALVFQGLPAYAHDATPSELSRSPMLAKLRAASPRALCVAGPSVVPADKLTYSSASKPRALPRLALPEQTNQRAHEVVDPSARSLRLGWAVASRDTELALHSLALRLVAERIATRLIDARPAVVAQLDRRDGPSLASLSVTLPPDADTVRFRERVYRELVDLAKTGPSERELYAAKSKEISALSETFSGSESACFAVAAERRDPTRELARIQSADTRALRLIFAGDLGPQRRSVVTVWSGVNRKSSQPALPGPGTSTPKAGTSTQTSAPPKNASPTKPSTAKKTGAKRKP